MIPESYLDLMTEKRAIAHLATIMEDGGPQVTPVWFLYDGEYIIVNSAKGRTKDRNMSARPQVAVEIIDPDNPYRYVTIRGRVVDIVEGETAISNITDLAQKYTGKPEFNYGDEVRRMYKISIDAVYPTK